MDGIENLKYDVEVCTYRMYECSKLVKKPLNV